MQEIQTDGVGSKLYRPLCRRHVCFPPITIKLLYYGKRRDGPEADMEHG
jgi:hypothetical protein